MLPQQIIQRPYVCSTRSTIPFGKLSSGLFSLVVLFSVSFVCTLSGTRACAQTADYYVSPSGNDSNPGTLDEPFATFNQARIAADALLQKDKGERTNPITVMFRAGTYFFSSTLNFASTDSGTSSLGIVYENYPGETPVFTGGLQVTNWNNHGGNNWQATLPSSTKYFEQLWYKGERRLRPRLGATSSALVGTYYRLASPVYTSSSQTNCTVETSPGQYECFDRIQYNSADPISKTWKNLSPPVGNPCGSSGNSYPSGDIELDLFERWNMSKMRISCIDTTNHIIYFTGPTATTQDTTSATDQAPIANHRYLIENIKDDLTEPGQWFLDRSSSSWTLTYLTNSGENPNTDIVIIPQLAQLIVAVNLEYVTFSGLTFENDNWTIPTAGYPSVQQENAIPTAISCQNCQYITFDADTVTQTSGGGLEFITTNTSSTTAHNDIENSMFYDIGAMAVRIGMLPYYTDTDSNVAQFNTIQNTALEGFGRVIASAPALSQGDGHDNTYTHNDIYDGYQDGIELCAPACVLGQSDSHGVFNNISSFNHIYSIGQGILNDMGCIYYETDPSSTGNQILNNKCHDVMDASGWDADGYAGQGYYLDLNTANVTVENNIAYRLSATAMAQTCGPQSPNTANTIKNNIFAFYQQAAKQEGCAPANGVLQFNFTNNLIYYEPQSSVQSMCVYSPNGSLTAAQNYKENMYCYVGDPNCTMPSNAFFTTNAACTTHTAIDFSGWQALGEDSGSMVADPLFVNPYYPTDDFTLQSGSPASQVGFVAFNVNSPGRESGAAPVPAIAATYPTNPIEGTTTVTISSSESPSSWGQSVTLTATVASQIGPPPNGETVTFTNNGVSLGSASLNQGLASITASSLAIGANMIQATYAGDTMWTASTSNSFNQWVKDTTSTVSETSSLNPALAGQPVTFTATVKSSDGTTPTGSVTFKGNGTTLGTVNLSGGVAQLTTSTLRVGTTNVSAQYSPGTGFSGGSASVSQVISDSTTTITETSSANPALVGQSITFTATVKSSQGTPTGTVTFKGNGTSLGTINLSSGVAKVTTSTLRVGTTTISAQYNPDTGFSGTSTTLSQVVNLATTTTTITSATPNPANSGQAVTFVGKVSGGDAPTGSVRFYSGSTYLGKADLSGGTGSYTTTGKQLPVGSDSITATYSGDANNSESTSKAITETVN